MNPHHRRWQRRLAATVITIAAVAGGQAVLAAPAHAGQVVVDVTITGKGSVTVVEGTPEDGAPVNCNARADVVSNYDSTSCPRWRNEEFFEAWSWLRATPANGEWTFDAWRGCNSTRVRNGATECAVKSSTTTTDTRSVTAVFVDRTPPEVPRLEVSTVTDSERKIGWYVQSLGATSFQCDFDKAQVWDTCAWAGSRQLPEGRHQLSVVAADPSFNLTAQTTRTFSVVDTAITSGPDARSRSRDASFGLSSGIGTRFTCQLDDGPWEVCADGATTATVERTGLGEGEHTFRVKASDGTWTDPLPAVRTWTVDSVAPETTLRGGPTEGSLVPNQHVELGVDGGEGSTLACSLDGAVVDCSQGYLMLNRLQPGRHVLSAVATDAFGNTDATPAVRSWTQPYGSRVLTPGSGAARGFKQVDTIYSYAGSEAVATRKGATLTGKVSGARTIALVAVPSAGQGKITVSLGKKKVATFDLAKGTGNIALLTLPVRKTAYTGKVVVTTTSAKPVRIQGLGWL